MIVKLLLITLIILAASSLFYAARALTKSQADNRGVVWGLTVRIILSIICFIVIMVSYYLGYLVPSDSVKYLHMNTNSELQGEENGS